MSSMPTSPPSKTLAKPQNRSAPPPGEEERTPALRPRATADELASLHPLEQILYRLFEFCSSVNLAIILMSWLIIELTVGTFIEARVNTQAARYFVYGHWHFSLLLALLGLNVACAALIRYPWKRYQTGFLVTHTGLLIILAGSLWNTRGNLDAQLNVELGRENNVCYDPNFEQMHVTYYDQESKRPRETHVLPVNFGPFTWGTKLFSMIPWYPNRVDTLPLQEGTLKIKKFFANCTVEETVIEQENSPPVVGYRLTHPRAPMLGRQVRWLVGEPRIGEDSLEGLGYVRLWRVENEAELQHFLQAIPSPTAPSTVEGLLGYSYQGKHHLFSLEQLRQGPVKVPDTDITIHLAKYIPNFQTMRDPHAAAPAEEEPAADPILMLQVTCGGQDENFVVSGRGYDFNRVLRPGFRSEHLFTYFPAGGIPMVHLGIMPDGRLAYRALGSQGLITCTLAEVGKTYPCWGDTSFTATAAAFSGRRDLRLKEIPLEKGKPGRGAIVAELTVGDQSTRTALLKGGEKRSYSLNGRHFDLQYAVNRTTLPFQVRLEEFHEPKNPGSQMAMEYESVVTITEGVNAVPERHRIYMNHPLYYTDKKGLTYILFQSGIDRGSGIEVSTYTVARHPGLPTIYVGCVTLVVGIFLMFYMGGYFRKASPYHPPETGPSAE